MPSARSRSRLLRPEPSQARRGTRGRAPSESVFSPQEPLLHEEIELYSVRRLSVSQFPVKANQLTAAANALATPRQVEKDLTTSDSVPIHWLRENGRYLAPNGAGDQWIVIATILRNWVAVALVMSVLVLTVLMTGHWMEQSVRQFVSTHSQLALGFGIFSRQSSGIYWSPLFAPPLAVLLLVAVPFGWAYWLG